MSCQPMELRDVQIAEAEWKVVVEAEKWAEHPETPRTPQDIPLYDAVTALITLRDQSHDNHPR